MYWPGSPWWKLTGAIPCTCECIKFFCFTVYLHNTSFATAFDIKNLRNQKHRQLKSFSSFFWRKWYQKPAVRELSHPFSAHIQRWKTPRAAILPHRTCPPFSGKRAPISMTRGCQKPTGAQFGMREVLGAHRLGQIRVAGMAIHRRLLHGPRPRHPKSKIKTGCLDFGF